MNAKAMPKTKYERPKPDKPLTIILDAGNSDVKAMLHGHYGEEIVFPQLTRLPSPAEYARLTDSYRQKSAQFRGTALFERDGQGFVIGRHAETSGEAVQRHGVDKYERDGIGAMLIAALIQLHPESHADVHVVVLHPADVNRHNLKRLGKALHGTHKVTIADGRKLTFKVTTIIPIEEPVAGFQTFLLTTEGKTYQRPRVPFLPGTRYLVLDVGGWITSFASVIINDLGQVEINVTDIPVIQRGIQNIVETFEAEIKEAHTELSGIQTLPRPDIYKALMNDYYTAWDGGYECAQETAAAMAPLARRVREEYFARYNQGIGFRGVIVTGGGGGAVFSYFTEHVFERLPAYTAEEELTRMRFSNIRGAAKGYTNFLIENK